MNLKKVVLTTGIIFLVISIALMAVAEHVFDYAFLGGVGLFIVSIIIFITSLFWKVASSADDFIARHW